MEPAWLEWSKRLQAAAQNGLAYTTNPFDIERFEQIREIAIEMMAAHTGADHPVIRDLFAGQTGHATPKVDVRGAVFADGRILLVRELADGRWSLPGGWADVYDTPSAAVVREIWEESGYHTRAVKLLAVWDRALHGHPPMPFHVYKIVMRCELTGGEATTSKETDEVGWFPLDGLPLLSTGRVTEAQIVRLFEHYRDPSLPTDWD